MNRKNEKKLDWKKVAVAGGIFAAGIAIGIVGDKAYIKMLVEKGCTTCLKNYRLGVDKYVSSNGIDKVLITVTDKLTGKSMGTAWLPNTAMEIGMTIIANAQEVKSNGRN